MTTYEKLHKIVSPHLRLYIDDLIKHDKKILDEYDGPFLYGYRETGTDLIKLMPGTMQDFFNASRCPKDMDEAEKTLLQEIVWVTYGHNKFYLYYDGKKLIHVTKERIELLWRNYVMAVKLRSPEYFPKAKAITI